MNSSDSQILLERVTTSHLIRPSDDTIESGFSRINKEAIVMAVPNDTHEKDRLAQAARIYFRGELLQYRVLVVMGNFEISGNLHIEPDRELTQVFDPPRGKLYRHDRCEHQLPAKPGPARHRQFGPYQPVQSRLHLRRCAIIPYFSIKIFAGNKPPKSPFC